MYKDKDRQRQAVRDATKRYRARLKGITIETPAVIPVIPKLVIPKPAKPIAGELTKARQVGRKGFNN